MLSKDEFHVLWIVFSFFQMGEKSNCGQCFDLKEAALSLQSSGPSKWSAKQQYQRHNYQKHKSQAPSQPHRIWNSREGAL